MHLEIITPDKTIFEGEVVSTTLPGSDGYFQILDNHAPMVSSLGKGELKYLDKDDNEVQHQIEGGVAEVLSNKVVVLAEKIIED